MKAIVFEGRHAVSLRSLPQPDPAPHEVLIRVAAAGLCGTDYHIVAGTNPAATPVVLGHEFAGTIEVCGAAVTGIQIGALVAVDPNIPCGVCAHCRRGDVCLCPRRVAIGVDLNGGLAEYCVVPAAQVYLLPPHVTATQGALCEPLACCIHGIDLARIPLGGRVLVLGGGFIGLLMVQLARLAGAGHVVLATRQATRRQIALALGADESLDPLAAPLADALSAPPDVVIECVGSVQTVEQSIALVARGGTVVVFGVAPQGQTARISPYDIFAREIRVVGAYLNPRTHGRAIALIAQRRISVDPLVTASVALPDVSALLTQPPAPGSMKTVVQMPV